LNPALSALLTSCSTTFLSLYTYTAHMLWWYDEINYFCLVINCLIGLIWYSYIELEETYSWPCGSDLLDA
jgi:hypothetical protein